MSNDQYNGFLFEWSRPDVNSLGGLQKTRYIVIETTLDRAREAMAGEVPVMADVSLIDQGQAVLEKGRRRGFPDGSVNRL
jgi:hypothetical protein